jgi:hypothetical protein
MLFILYMIHLVNFNWFGMMSDGTQTVNSRVSYTQQGKQFQDWMTSC